VARDEATTAEKTAAPAVTPPPPRASGLRRWRWPLMIGGPLLIIAIAAYFVLTGGRTQATDDSYVEAARIPVSASIGGRVIELDVHENQHVKAGQVLFRLDTRDYGATQDQAAAQVASAKLQVQALQAAYQQQQSALKMANETAVHNTQMAKQSIATAQQQLARALADLGGANGSAATNPGVLQAQAAYDRAKLNVGYGTVVAAQDGVVTRVEQLQVGSYVNPAQTLFWLVAGEPWVESNFKEDQLAKMRVGQPAKIAVDACPGSDFDGHVASFSPGAGQAFSPLPVRIAFDKPPPDVCGAAGLSANVTVDVRSGSARRQAAQP
jgi:membrane fusion protein (multidrug efflux system)